MVCCCSCSSGTSGYEVGRSICYCCCLFQLFFYSMYFLFTTLSWILKERRRAGIPDSDKRPFKIAKADVEEKQRVTSKSRDSDLRLRQPRVTFTPTAHKTRELSENHIVPPQEPLRRSKSITHRGNPLKKKQSNDDVLILNDENLTMVDENDSSTQKYLSGEKNPTLVNLSF
ncbi:hypothetical protein BY996DRAFT_1014796 [Phakopsora pachyrhizi]|nr:hypothetical protein BY996DRAFT_1014796 [Phakopsora pachyrhizi]